MQNVFQRKVLPFRYFGNPSVPIQAARYGQEKGEGKNGATQSEKDRETILRRCAVKTAPAVHSSPGKKGFTQFYLGHSISKSSPIFMAGMSTIPKFGRSLALGDPTLLFSTWTNLWLFQPGDPMKMSKATFYVV